MGGWGEEEIWEEGSIGVEWKRKKGEKKYGRERRSMGEGGK